MTMFYLLLFLGSEFGSWSLSGLAFWNGTSLKGCKLYDTPKHGVYGHILIASND